MRLRPWSPRCHLGLGHCSRRNRWDTVAAHLMPTAEPYWASFASFGPSTAAFARFGGPLPGAHAINWSSVLRLFACWPVGALSHSAYCTVFSQLASAICYHSLAYLYWDPSPTFRARISWICFRKPLWTKLKLAIFSYEIEKVQVFWLLTRIFVHTLLEHDGELLHVLDVLWFYFLYYFLGAHLNEVLFILFPINSFCVWLMAKKSGAAFGIR